MNERIKQFAKQTLSKDQFGLWLAGDEDIEKFAELIVRECLDILDDEDTGDVYGKSVRLAMIRIKKQFGVEE